MSVGNIMLQNQLDYLERDEPKYALIQKRKITPTPWLSKTYALSKAGNFLNEVPVWGDPSAREPSLSIARLHLYPV